MDVLFIISVRRIAVWVEWIFRALKQNRKLVVHALNLRETGVERLTGPLGLDLRQYIDQ